MIHRDPRAAEQCEYELIVVGGGIYGACLSLEASRRGLRCLLIEKDDFGHATSWNCLRIIHGGLRYLQQFNLRRFGESVAERHWFLQHFPDQVEPMRCLMPLYGRGLRRPAVMRFALALNDLLSARRNRGLRNDRRIERGRVLSKAETISLFPRVATRRLQGAAMWQDAYMRSPQRLIIEIIRWAAACGATFLNYVEAEELVTRNGETAGVAATDRETGVCRTFRAPVVINCCGPWCREIARRFNCNMENHFRPSLAFNVLLDVQPLADVSLAVAAEQSDAQTFFLVPWRGMLLAGTVHAPWEGEVAAPAPTSAQLEWFVQELNLAVPGLDAKFCNVVRTYAGLLPASASNPHGLATRETFVDHGRQGGPQGLYSVVGVKYTTARRVAEKVLKRVYNRISKLAPKANAMRPPAVDWIDFESPTALLGGPSSEAARKITQIMHEEAALHLDDFLLRRTDWTRSNLDAQTVGEGVCHSLQWDLPRRERELARLGSVRDRLPPAEVAR